MLEKQVKKLTNKIKVNAINFLAMLLLASVSNFRVQDEAFFDALKGFSMV